MSDQKNTSPVTAIEVTSVSSPSDIRRFIEVHKRLAKKNLIDKQMDESMIDETRRD